MYNIVDKEKEILDAMRDAPVVSPRIGGRPHTLRFPCEQQVFATLEVAENQVRSLAKAHIHARPVRCPDCGLIHLDEDWSEVYTLPRSTTQLKSKTEGIHVHGEKEARGASAETRGGEEVG